MSFISLEFVLFFIIVVPIYFRLPHRWRWVWLLLASYFFYAYWNVSYIILIVFSTLVDYIAGKRIGALDPSQTAQRRRWLILSLAVNLGVLFTFKYYNWFSGSVVDSMTALGLNVGLPQLDVLLPVGISFYTFQSMSYTIDVYRGRLQPEQHVGIFATYVALFPQLVAGPIERATNILPQIRQQYTFNAARATEGLQLILWGVFKKVAIGDRLAIYVNAVYNDVESYSGIPLITATVFFAFQIYCDFSGYSDIAIGVARLMGFDLMENFRQPYFSLSIREFWRRWHISLSTWFRDYLYIPLGGNRVPFLRNLLNLMIVFVVSGLWHGANWTFVIWGAVHGVFIVIETIAIKLTADETGKRSRVQLPVMLRWGYTFGIVCLAWVFFRANTLQDSVYVINNIFNFTVDTASITAPFADGVLNASFDFALAIALIIILLIVDVFTTRTNLFQTFQRPNIVLRWGWYYLLLGFIGLTLLSLNTTEAFIYFQF